MIDGSVCFSAGYVTLEEIHKVLTDCPRIGQSWNHLVGLASLKFEAGNFWKRWGSDNDPYIEAKLAWPMLRSEARTRSNIEVRENVLLFNLDDVAVRIRRVPRSWRLTVAMYGHNSCLSSVAKYLLAETSLELRVGYVQASDELIDLRSAGDLVMMGDVLIWAGHSRSISAPITIKERLRRNPPDDLDLLALFGTVKGQP